MKDEMKKIQCRMEKIENEMISFQEETKKTLIEMKRVMILEIGQIKTEYETKKKR